MTEPAIGSVEWWLHRQMSPAELVDGQFVITA